MNFKQLFFLFSFFIGFQVVGSDQAEPVLTTAAEDSSGDGGDDESIGSFDGEESDFDGWSDPDEGGQLDPLVLGAFKIAQDGLISFERSGSSLSLACGAWRSKCAY